MRIGRGRERIVRLDEEAETVKVGVYVRVKNANGGWMRRTFDGKPQAFRVVAVLKDGVIVYSPDTRSEFGVATGDYEEVGR